MQMDVEGKVTQARKVELCITINGGNGVKLRVESVKAERTVTNAASLP